jgi:beta-barrel assembly-enhancing protease
MKASHFLGPLAALCLAACTTGEVKKSSLGSEPIDEQQQLTDAEKLVDEKNWPQAQTALRTIIEAPTFRRLPGPQQYQVLSTASDVGIHHGDINRGFGYLLRAVSFPEAGFDQWRTLTFTAMKLGRPDIAANGLTEIAKLWPEKVSTIDLSFIYWIIDQARHVPDATRLALFRALYAAHWKVESVSEPSEVWRDLTLLLLEARQLTEALQVSAHVTDLYILIAMRSDRRFDAVVAAHPEQFHIDAAAPRELHDLQLASEQSPRSLFLKLEVLRGLQRRQHYAAMMAAADEVVLELRTTNYPEKLYDDFRSRYSEFLDERAIALERLGRWDEALAQLTAASRTLENSRRNVSQVINLADLFCQLNRPSDALATLGQVGPNVSAHGAMVMEGIRLQVAVQLGDQSQATRSLEYLRTHSDDATGVYLEALIYAGKLDDATRFLVAQLLDPNLRQDYLVQVQDYAPYPTSEWEMQWYARWREVLARKDVQAAIRKVGRIDAYQLEQP